MTSCIRISPASGERAQMVPVGPASSFQIDVRFIGGSSEYMIGVSTRKAGNARTLFGDTSSCFCVIGSQHYHASWYGLAKDLPVLPQASHNVNVDFNYPSVTFQCGDQKVSGKVCTKGDLAIWILTCWDDTEVHADTPIFRKAFGSGGYVGEALYQQRKFTDATLRCGGQSIPIHRAVLASASPVFDSLFESAMTESAQAVVEIKDVELAAVEVMIQYTYTHELNVDTPLLAQLFMLACKYMVRELAGNVGREMLSRLDGNNAKEFAEVIRLHASSGNEEASELWEQFLVAIRSDEQITKALLEALIDCPPRKVMRRERSESQ